MKLSRLCFVAVLLFSPGCERARNLAKRWTGKGPTTKTVAVVTGPLVTELSGGEMDSFPQKRGRLSIVEYHAAWSGPSRQLGPLLESITAEYAGVVALGKVDVDQFREVATKEGVKDLPDVRIYRDGLLVDRIVGPLDEEVVRKKVAGFAKGLPPPGAAGEAPAGKAVARPMPRDWMPAGMRRR